MNEAHETRMTKAELAAIKARADRALEEYAGMTQLLADDVRLLIAEVERLVPLLDWWYRKSLHRPHSTQGLVEKLKETQLILGDYGLLK